MVCQRRMGAVRMRQNPMEIVPFESIRTNWQELGFEGRGTSVSGNFYAEDHKSANRVLQWLPESLANDPERGLPFETFVWLDGLRQSGQCYRVSVVFWDLTPDAPISVHVTEHVEGFDLELKYIEGLEPEIAPEMRTAHSAILVRGDERFTVGWYLRRAPPGVSQQEAVRASFLTKNGEWWKFNAHVFKRVGHEDVVRGERVPAMNLKRERWRSGITNARDVPPGLAVEYTLDRP